MLWCIYDDQRVYFASPDRPQLNEKRCLVNNQRVHLHIKPVPALYAKLKIKTITVSSSRSHVSFEALTSRTAC
jgi:hypothetical protein